MSKKSFVTITDQFCGAGGSSLGASRAGVEVHLALNHWQLAIETHNTNFPDTYHDCTDISACDPRRYPSTDGLITSPECTNHSIAKGSKRRGGQMSLLSSNAPDPAEERSRATMWDVPRFAEFHDYNFIIVENVIEIRTWRLFDAWLHAMKSLDYQWKFIYLNSMFAHPTPQSRDRVYVVFWKRGNKAPDLDIRPNAYCGQCCKDVQAVQSWKNQGRQWGRYKKQYVYRCPECAQKIIPYYYAAWNAIDWEIEAPIIKDRKKPLKPKTLARIEIGLKKFKDERFIVRMKGDVESSAKSALEPLPALTTVGAPYIVDLAYTHAVNDRTRSLDDPMPTQTSRQTHALVQPPFIIELRNYSTAKRITEPLGTVTAGGRHHGVIMPFLATYNNHASIWPVTEAAPTIATRDRLSLIEPGATPRVEDCGFRMLQPHEVGRAMAFPDDYVVLGTNRDKVRQFGNAVTPPVMEMLVGRCVESLA